MVKGLINASSPHPFIHPFGDGGCFAVRLSQKAGKRLRRNRQPCLGDFGMPSHVAYVVSNNLGSAWLPTPGQGCQSSQESPGSCHLGLFRVLAHDRSYGLCMGSLPQRSPTGPRNTGLLPQPLYPMLTQGFALAAGIDIQSGSPTRRPPALTSEVGSASLPDSLVIKAGNSLGTCRRRLQPHSPWLLPRLVPWLWPTTQLQECPMA